ncbi:hypothetical protein V500_02873 [Pseudogymnoascus sp. VKM F-4518 (FW-2643)]|nr:hypothetical protein V500_02873 [Pseudogymnoascus sp. VKM F-4518 (FW-2643)]
MVVSRPNLIRAAIAPYPRVADPWHATLSGRSSRVVYGFGKMRLLGLLVGVSIVSFAAALTPYPNECDPALNLAFNGTDTALFVRCAETTYSCNSRPPGEKWFSINSTNEAVPADCEKQIFSLHPISNFTGPLAMPGLTELSSFKIGGYYNGTRFDDGPDYVLFPATVTSIDLPDLVNITSYSFNIYIAHSISSLSVPKLRHIGSDLSLNLTGGPAINLTFPSLFDVRGGIYLFGEIDALGFPTLNHTQDSINVTSTGNLDCDAFAASVVNTTNSTGSSKYFVTCTSKMGSVILHHVLPPEPEVNGAAFQIRGDFLALTALVAYILAL